MKRILALLLICVMAFSISIPAFAATEKTESYPYETAGDDVKAALTEEEYNGLPLRLQKSAWLYGIPNPEECENGNQSRAVTASHFIPSFASFNYYVAGDFTQKSNVCMPTAVANCLSYFDYIGRSGLISGSRVSQAEFTEICNRTSWNSSSGTSLYNGVNGLATYCSARGYTATDFMHTFQIWINLKNNLDSNYPVFIAEPSHADFCTGYKAENGEKLLFIYTGNGDLPIAWLNFDDVNQFDRIWIN